MTFRLRYWLAGAAALATIAAILLLRNTNAESAAPATIEVKRGDVTSSVAASGKVQPIATRELSFAIAGTVTAVNVKTGDSVTAAQTLATIDATDAQDAVDDAESTLDNAEETLAAEQAKAASASAAPAKDNIYSAEVAVTKAQQALNKAKRDLSGTQIKAPVGGKVLSVAGKAGDDAKTSTFITIAVVENMMVKAEFAEADAVTLAVGQKAEVQLASKPGETFAVTIAEVSAVGTVSDRLVRYSVLLAFDKLPADLLVGQSATAQVVVARSSNVLYLPQSAVKGNQVKLADGSAAVVEVGLRGDGNVEIISGLTEGAVVRLNAR